jgi:LPS-assembly lipoprotein
MTRRAALLLALGLLGGCGFRPMLKQEEGVGEELAAVEVPSLTGRVGYLVRDGLLEQLNPTGASVSHRYRLDVSLRRRTSSLGIQLDNTATRYNLLLVARFSLLDNRSGQVVYRSVIRRIASYNAIRAPYGELAAELDAERRAAREVSTDIRTQLATHFARQQEAAEEAAPEPS